MKIATIRVSGVEAVAVDVKKVTAGLTGAEVVMEYTDPLWNGLTKKVIFDGAETVSAVETGDRVIIPVEAVRQEGVLLRVGVYGVSSEGNLAIPTIWAEIGNVLPAVPGNSVGPGSQALAEWAQILAMIGDLRNLTTDARENLVAAINEAAVSGGSGGSSGSLPLPDTAAVGQFIAVSGVDDTGKVTATEAVTLTDAEEVAF